MERTLIHRSLGLFALIGVLMVSWGCTQRIADLTVMSTKNVNIGDEYTEVGTCTGEDTKYIALSIPLGTPNMKTAADNCLESANGSLLTNVVIKSRTVNFLLGGSNSMIVEGNVFEKASTAQVQDPNIETFTLTGSKDELKLVSNQTPEDVRDVQVDEQGSVSDLEVEQSGQDTAR